MEVQFYYIHGLYGSITSTKFLELQKQYLDIECLDWDVNDNIDKKLVEWERIIVAHNLESTCIIASSTGANFAVQLRNRNNIPFFFLVLINPLLNIDYSFDKTIMPQQLERFLVKIEQLKESLILISEKDQVIDNVRFIKDHSFISNWNQIIIDNQSSHKFETLDFYYEDIESLVNSIYL